LTAFLLGDVSLRNSFMPWEREELIDTYFIPKEWRPGFKREIVKTRGRGLARKVVKA
jgi:hypothetical protein